MLGTFPVLNGHMPHMTNGYQTGQQRSRIFLMKSPAGQPMYAKYYQLFEAPKKPEINTQRLKSTIIQMYSTSNIPKMTH